MKTLDFHEHSDAIARHLVFEKLLDMMSKDNGEWNTEFFSFRDRGTSLDAV